MSSMTSFTPGVVAAKRHGGVSIGIIVRMTAQRHDAVLDLQSDGVEHVAVSHRGRRSKLLQELFLQLGVGDRRAGNLNIVAHRRYALHFVHGLFGVGLVLVKADRCRSAWQCRWRPR